MIKTISRLAIAGGILLAAVGAFAQNISWVPNWKSALADSGKSGKLIMASFYTQWDQYGKMLDTVVYTNKDVIAVSKKFVPVRLDVEGVGAAQAKKYNVKNYPTILFLDPKGNVVGTIDGLETPDEFVKHANMFLKDYGDFAKVSAKAAANPRDLDSITRLGVICADRYEAAKAQQYLQKAEAIDPQNKTDKITDLYNAIGDHYQNASKFTEAIKYFDKAARTSKSTDKRAYGYLSIATCYMTMNPPQYRKMEAPLDAARKLPNLKAEDKEIEQSLRDQMEKGLNGG